MIERKKDYIMDALGELEDSFIAEAAEYVKSKTKWRYWREMGAAVACVAAVAVTVATLQFLPIGKMTETAAIVENTGQMTENKQEMAMDGVVAENTVEESASVESAVVETVTSKEGEDIGNIQETDREVLYSQGIKWDIVEADQAKENTEQSGCIQESSATVTVQNESISEWLSAEEIFAQGNDIFMGIVTDKQVYHVTGKMNKYFTVVTVEVKDSIRGEQEVGEVCRIYLPLAAVNGVVSTNSLVGDLMKLEIGSSAIFMPMTATKDTGLGKQDVGEWLCYADFADYYFSEGMRYLFLATEDGVSYEEDVYEIPGEEITLVEVAEYIRKMLAER